MGLFDFIGGITSTIGKTIEKSVIIPTANVIGSTIQKVTGANYTPQTAESVFSNPVGKVYTNLLGGAAVALPIAAVGPAAVAKTAVKNPLTSLGVVVGGTILSKSEKAQNFTSTVVAEAPKDITNYAGNIGEAIQTPSIPKIKEVFTENPVLAGATVAGLAYIGGKALNPIISNIITKGNTEAVQENTEASIKSQIIQQGGGVLEMPGQAPIVYYQGQKIPLYETYSPAVAKVAETTPSDAVVSEPAAGTTPKKTATKKKKSKKKAKKKPKKKAKKKAKTKKKTKKKKSIKRKKRK